LHTPAPTLPSPLPEIEVVDRPRRGVPLAVLATAGQDGEPVLGPGADGLPAGWLDGEIRGRAGEVQPIPGDAVRWVAGLGRGEPGEWRSAGAALVRAVRARAERDDEAGRPVAGTLQLALTEDADAERVGSLVLGTALGGYRYRVSEQDEAPRLRTLRLIAADGADVNGLAEAARRALALASATSLARDLVNTPSNVKDPAWLAGTAADLAGGVLGLDAEVRDESWLAEQGFGGILAVGGGSASPPRLVELSWRPPSAGQGTPRVVLVGKGITFDTGGISVKPADGMHLMRTDMAGGAAVIAALRTVADLGLPVRVTGLVPCAENHLSGSAYRPGDVVRHYGGATTEVTNTDAEGRMVLADALAYAVRRHEPDLLVDVATLTGAMKVSLGLRTGGLFASDDGLADRIAAAGRRVGEAWWRMPLLAEHADDVRSDIADLRQAPPGPGGITAALFLREFTEGLPWAHLDIAGPARADRPYDEVVPVGTGFAARTLVEFAASYT
jgi:leucyl aminopeptidase